MNIDKAALTDQFSATVKRNTGLNDAIGARGVFHVKCFDAEGTLKWEAENHNLVVNVGLQDMNTRYFTGSSYTAAFYIGLWGASASNDANATDTMASHPAAGAGGWTEVTAYSNATRPAAVFGVATTANPSVITNSGSPAVFTINGTTTIGGAFLVTDNTKGGTAGTLFSGSNFTTPGDRSVVSGDTLSVTYAFSLTAT